MYQVFVTGQSTDVGKPFAHCTEYLKFGEAIQHRNPCPFGENPPLPGKREALFLQPKNQFSPSFHSLVAKTQSGILDTGNQMLSIRVW